MKTHTFKKSQIPLKKCNRGKNVLIQERDHVVAFAARCMRELSKAKYELPPLDKEMLVHVKHKGQRSYGGYEGITIDVRHLRGHLTTLREYKAIAEHPVIGELKGISPWLVLDAVTAHEVAHHVQQRYAMLMRPAWRDQMEKAHGQGWQRIYGHLRRALINPRA